MEKKLHIWIDDQTSAIIARKAHELKSVYGTSNTSAAVRNIILEWNTMLPDTVRNPQPVASDATIARRKAQQEKAAK